MLAGVLFGVAVCFGLQLLFRSRNGNKLCSHPSATTSKYSTPWIVSKKKWQQKTEGLAKHVEQIQHERKQIVQKGNSSRSTIRNTLSRQEKLITLRDTPAILVNCDSLQEQARLLVNNSEKEARLCDSVIALLKQTDTAKDSLLRTEDRYNEHLRQQINNCEEENTYLAREESQLKKKLRHQKYGSFLTTALLVGGITIVLLLQ